MITILLIILTGLAAGFLSGLMGVGGGLILIPAIVLLLNISQHTAQGISLLVIIPTATAGVWRLYKDRLVDLTLVLPLSIGAVLGAIISASFIQTISSGALKTSFGLFTIAVGINTLRKALKKRTPTTEDNH